MTCPLPCRLAAALFAMLLVASPAMADGFASAAITGVRLGALDLTPDDGVAAGFSISGITPALSATLYGASSDHYSVGYPGPDVPASVALVLSDSASSAATDGTLGHVTSRAFGTAALGEFGYGTASGSEEVRVLLEPHSVLTIGGHLSSLAYRTDEVRDYDTVGLTTVSIVGASGHTYTQLARQSLSYADWPARMAIEDDFMLAFANGTAQRQAVSLYFQAWSAVTRSVTPVPEPPMAALLLGGAVLLAAQRKRGKVRSRGSGPT
ncbi:hypothetical protein ACFFTM_10340 [Pseudoduganella plicata]|uniref:PEP-CTERM sorting domain-containing protein n=1 Tax=Pseudoduganella plicata TaxID=321984 RepID=A0A4V1ATM1_9BURK|nr:hypothetical protein [Pseudoduganella plicata]QBQ36148.1 hypothetical protein E1742_08260 [Pseudoduganella plicata]GGY77727.1 hypothetical protein GCM10007388_08160 [Pseudoduganella plicata]